MPKRLLRDQLVTRYGEHQDFLSKWLKKASKQTSQRMAHAALAEVLHRAMHAAKGDGSLEKELKLETLFALDLIMRGVSDILEGELTAPGHDISNYAIGKIEGGVRHLSMVYDAQPNRIAKRKAYL